MLAFILKDTKKKIYTEVHFDEKIGFHGFAIEQDSIHKVHEDVFDILNMLKLSEKNISCGIKEDYEIYYDENSGLYHYFKNGKEDTEKFWLENSEMATLVRTYHDRLDLAKSYMRKVKILGYTLLISAVICDMILVKEAVDRVEDGKWEMEVEYNDSIGTISYTPLSRTVKFTFEEEEERFNKKVTSEKIYELIYSSENLRDIDKDFLWNSELVNDVMPYYDDFQTNVVRQVRHYNMYLLPFDENEYMNTTESAGYYNGDNILHIRNIPTSSYNEENKEQWRIVAHEYVHLLQVNDYLKFLTESSAELITHEYFLNSADSNTFYAYDRACRYTKILMEIIGPEAIWDYNFRNGSTSVQDAVKPYFSDNEYIEFFHILTLSPFWDEEELEGGLYNRLEELLGVLYNGKYNEDIKNNDLITAIKLGVHHNRAYFRKSLIENETSYYMNAQIMSLDEAEMRYGENINFSRQIIIDRSKHQEVCDKLFKDGVYFNSHLRVVDANYQVQNVIMESIQNHVIVGKVTLKNGEELIGMDIEEAYSKGYVNIESVFVIPISCEEFKMNYKKGEYFVELYDDAWRFDYDNMVFVGCNYETIECEEKTISLEEAYNLGLARITYTKLLSEDEYLNFDRDKYPDVRFQLTLQCDVDVLENKSFISGTSYKGSIVCDTGSGPKEIEINEAINLGLVKKLYILDRVATLEEYLLHSNDKNYRIHEVSTPEILVMRDFSQTDSKEITFSVTECKKNFVPSINEKILGVENHR